MDKETCDRLIRESDELIDGLRAELDAACNEPNRLEHFRRVALATVGPEGATEDELRAALEEDFFWSVEEGEKIRAMAEYTVMRDHLIKLRDELD